MKPQLEKEIQLAICDYLAYKHVFFWRQNTSPIFDKKSGFYRPMPKHSLNGVPDIIIIKNGIFIGLEVKTPKTFQSDNQKDFERRCVEAGGKYFVVRSIEDVEKIIN